MCIFLNILLSICFIHFLHEAIYFNEFVHFEIKQSHNLQHFFFFFLVSPVSLDVLNRFFPNCIFLHQLSPYSRGGKRIIFRMILRSISGSKQLVAAFTRIDNCMSLFHLKEESVAVNTILGNFVITTQMKRKTELNEQTSGLISPENMGLFDRGCRCQDDLISHFLLHVVRSSWHVSFWLREELPRMILNNFCVHTFKYAKRGSC